MGAAELTAIYWSTLAAIAISGILGFIYYTLVLAPSRKKKNSSIEDIDKHTIGNMLYMQSRSHLRKQNGMALDA